MVRQVPEGRQAGHDDPAVGLAAFGRSWESLAALAPAGLVGLAASADEGPYVVTELLEGATLRDRLRDALSLKRTLDPRQIATGLAAAQAKGTGHWGVEVRGGAEISLSAPRSLASNLNLNSRNPRHAAARDGQFLIVRVEGSIVSNVNLVLNWDVELERLTRSTR